MAKVTSSRDRSKGKAKIPVTTTKGRANRQSVSKATVTQGGTKGTGTAKVTTGRGGGRPALPPGKPGGALAKSAGGAATDARIYQTSVGEVTKRPKALQQSSTKALPPGKPGGPIVSGGARTSSSSGSARPALSAAKSAASKAPRGGNIAAVIGQMAGDALSPYANAAGRAAGTAIRQRFGNTAQRSETQARTSKATQQGPAAPQRKPKPPASPPSRTTSSPSSSGGAGAKGSAGSSRPSPSIPRAAMPAAGKQPASNAGMKNQDKNYRGNPDKAGSIASQLKELRSMGGDRTSGTGPVKDGKQYADKLASSKKPETKKPSLQEQIRKRRLGL